MHVNNLTDGRWIKNHSETLVVVIHEIYGINEHMNSVCDAIASQGYDVFCPNLLGREPFNEKDAEDAYHYFMSNIGFIRASQQLKKLVEKMKSQYEHVWIIGFSIGATIAWLCSEEESIDGIVGFYGSRIRDYLTVSPKCSMLLIFPEEEQSFQVDQLLFELKEKNIDCVKLSGSHGFMNPYSAVYHEQSSQIAHQQMLRFIANSQLK